MLSDQSQPCMHALLAFSARGTQNTEQHSHSQLQGGSGRCMNYNSEHADNITHSKFSRIPWLKVGSELDGSMSTSGIRFVIGPSAAGTQLPEVAKLLELMLVLADTGVASDVG